MKKLLVLFLVTILLFSFFSCQNKTNKAEETTTTEQIPTEISATFDTVEEFEIAIKKDPSKYEGKLVSVKGYASELTLLSKRMWIYDDLLPNDQKYDGRPRIKVVITDSLKLSVIEDGDFIDLNGVVTITSEETYLNHCTYTMIKTNEEQNAK